MLAYVFLVAITIIVALFLRCYYAYKQKRYPNGFDEVRVREKESRLVITVFFVIYILLLCFRDISVGVDVEGYIVDYFDLFKRLSWKQLIDYKKDELAFSLLTKLIGYVFSSAQVYLSILAVISVAPIMYFYRRESRDAVLCCSFFLISLLFEFFFSGLRQSVAIGLVVPAYYCVKERKKLLFLLIVAIAMAFHTSGIIILLIYPVYNAKITVKWLWFVVPSMVAIYLFKSQIFNFLLIYSGEKYYTKYGVWGMGQTNQYGLLVLFVLIAVYCFVMLNEKEATMDDIGFRNLLLLATVIQFFAPLHFIVSRMNYYFILFIPVALTRANDKCKPKFRQIAKLASAVMILYFVFYFFFKKGDALQMMNYKLFF